MIKNSKEAQPSLWPSKTKNDNTKLKLKSLGFCESTTPFYYFKDGPRHYAIDIFLGVKNSTNIFGNYLNP